MEVLYFVLIWWGSGLLATFIASKCMGKEWKKLSSDEKATAYLQAFAGGAFLMMMLIIGGLHLLLVEYLEKQMQVQKLQD